MHTIQQVSVTQASLHHASNLTLSSSLGESDVGEGEGVEGGDVGANAADRVGGALAMVEDGIAMFQHVTVRKNAGRFRMQLPGMAICSARRQCLRTSL